MTRVNCIDPELMLDEWVAAHCREGLRPINKLRDGRYAKEPIIGEWSLNKGHELKCAGIASFTVNMWHKYKKEWTSRGGNGFNFESSATLEGIPAKYHNDYIPTVKDYRHNLARLCERFRKRSKSKPYHFHGKKIDTIKEFRQYVAYVKKQLGI